VGDRAPLEMFVGKTVNSVIMPALLSLRSQICAYFSLASANIELLAFFIFFNKCKLQSISEIHAATWQNKLADDLSQLQRIITDIFDKVCELKLI
jgi:hypothetical protein